MSGNGSVDVAGIDIVCSDIAVPLSQQRGGIIEVNAAPGIRMHQYPSRGKARDAGDAIVKSMFGSTDGRIPIIAVSGTNGKTTTTLMLAHGARLADLARVKGVVARAASRALVLNADDALCLAMAKVRRKGVEVLYFSTDADNPTLLRHLEKGGRGAYLEDGAVIIADGMRRHFLNEAALMPVSLGGHAKFNIANALATAGGMLAAGFDIVDIAVCLGTFESNGRNNPLRTNSFDVRGVHVIVDYAHNPAAYAALSEMGASMGASRVVAVLTAPGERREADLRDLGRTCARAFHALVVYESDGRGRPLGETARVILDGARDEDDVQHEHHCKLNVHEALRFGLTLCHEGDVLIFTCASSVMELVEALRTTDPAIATRIAAEVSPPASMPDQRRQADRRGARV